jgi:site-specific DNA-methyltransferase (adenine-specific)
VKPCYVDDAVTVWHGDCLDVLAKLGDCSVDAVCTDPPYGLEFMGKDWDRPWAVGMSAPGYTDAERMARPSFGDSRNANCRACGGRQRGARRCTCETPQWDRHPREDMLAYQQWCQQWAEQCLRVLKPGGHLLAFGGTRTSHRLVCAIEDAGFEIRDSIVWLYGSGFPKSLNVSKAIDRAAGAEREVVGESSSYARALKPGPSTFVGEFKRIGPEALPITAPATDDARTWQGWGTALKPGHEPIVVARKPLAGTVAANVLAYGTGALNIDAGRISFASDEDRASAQALAELRAKGRRLGVLGEPGQGSSLAVAESGDTRTGHEPVSTNAAGRWPPNVALDEAAAAELDQQSGQFAGVAGGMRQVEGQVTFTVGEPINAKRFEGGVLDFGGASRFFYVAKAPTHERPKVQRADGTWHAHPTVKPLTLIRWLVRLHTPPGGLVLDLFAGSGTTGEACIIEGFRSLLVEREPCGNCAGPHGCDDNIGLIMRRITKPIQPVLIGAQP